MQDPAFLSASLAVSGVFCVVLMAFIGYLLNRVLGGLLTVAVTYSGFQLMLNLAEKGLSGFSLFLLMLWLGLTWGYIAYFLLNGKLFVSAGIWGVSSGLVLILLKAAEFSKRSNLVFCGVILIWDLINVYVCYRNRSRIHKCLSITVSWYAFSLLFWIGHLIAGPVGILTVTIPASLLFWGTFFVFAGWYLLPIADADEHAQNGEHDRSDSSDAKHPLPPLFNDHLRAMKSVLTFILGTNYPYIALLDRKTVTRVEGNRFQQLFAGPGIILTGPDHAAAIWTGFKFRGVSKPGLTFTIPFEEIKEALDLRPQLRAFTVNATTKDGIPVSVFTFVPHRLDPHCRAGASRPEPELGTAFPCSQASVVKALHREAVEYERQGQGPEQIEFRIKGTWDTLVPRKAEEILTNVLAEYSFDELCAPFDMDRDPRTEIRNRFIKELEKTVAPWGIQVVGGGISNIVPPDEKAWTEDTVWRARIDNWRTAWTEKMLKELGYGEAEAMTTSYRLRGKVYAKYVARINRAAHQPGVSSQLKSNTLALRVADAVQDMLGNQLVRQSLSPDVIDTLDHISQAVRGNGAGRLRGKDV